MENSNNKDLAERLKNFGKIPVTVMNKIEPSEDKKQTEAIGGGAISDNEIMDTASHTEQLGFSGSTDTPIQPTPSQFGDNSHKQGTQLGQVVGGKMATDIFDIVFPSLAVWAVSMIGYNLPKGKLQLSAKEKEALNPAMQAYLDSININFNNPLYNLLFVLTAIYGAKVIDVFPEIQKVKKQTVKTVEQNDGNLYVAKTDEELIQEIEKKRKKGRLDAERHFNRVYKKVG